MKLSVLRFIEEHFSEVQPTIGDRIRTKNESIFDKSIASPKLNYQFAATVSEEIHEIPVKETNCRNK
jgi:hypothetical protein